jgi:hypothetical protein
MQYLWCEPSYARDRYTTGYFSPILSWFWDIQGFELWGQKIDIRQFLYEVSFDGVGLRELVRRIDDPYGDGRYSLAQWVEQKLTRLNSIIETAIANYGDSRIMIADSKSVYDRAPDRGVPGGVEYNEWVNVNVNRHVEVNDLAWNKITDRFGSVDELMGKIANDRAVLEELLNCVMNEVVAPDVDPHPKAHGQYALYRSFADVIRREIPALSSQPSLYRYNVSYAANGANGAMASEKVVSLDSTAFMVIKPLGFTHPTVGYRFEGWKNSAGSVPAAYYNSANQIEYYYANITSNATLTAQWSNLHRVNFYKKCNEQAHTLWSLDYSSNTGIQEEYGVYVSYDGGNSYSELDTNLYRGYFNKEGIAEKYISSKSFPYGTKLKVWVSYTRGEKMPITGYRQFSQTTSHIYVNGDLKMSDYGYPAATITLTGDTDIIFEWVRGGGVEYFGDATANWNAYINGSSPFTVGQR